MKTLRALGVVLGLVLLAFGYAANAGALYLGGEPPGLTAARTIGVYFPPVGGVLGWL